MNVTYSTDQSTRSVQLLLVEAEAAVRYCLVPFACWSMKPAELKIPVTCPIGTEDRNCA